MEYLDRNLRLQCIIIGYLQYCQLPVKKSLSECYWLCHVWKQMWTQSQMWKEAVHAKRKLKRFSVAMMFISVGSLTNGQSHTVMRPRNGSLRFGAIKVCILLVVLTAGLVVFVVKRYLTVGAPICQQGNHVFCLCRFENLVAFLLYWIILVLMATIHVSFPTDVEVFIFALLSTHSVA